MSDKKTEAQQRLEGFRQHMGSFFHDVLRAAGITMTPIHTDLRLREIGERLARTIETAAEIKSIEVIKKLQEAVVSAFEVVESRLNTQRNMINSQNQVIDAQTDVIQNLIDRVTALESLETLEIIDEDPTDGAS